MPFKLVVICSTENEYKSRMVAALDKYRIPQIAFGGEAHVKEYMSKSFIVENKDSRVDPASSVDFDRFEILKPCNQKFWGFTELILSVSYSVPLSIHVSNVSAIPQLLDGF